MRGSFSTKLNMNTQLDKKLNPNYETLFAEGVMTIPNAQLKDVKAINSVADAIKYDKLKDPSVSNVKVEYKVEKGRVYTKPFDVVIAGQKMNLSGSTGFDQTINYVGKIAVPRVALGVANSAANSVMDQLNKQGGTKIKLSDVINVNLNIGGTFSKPSVSTNMNDVVKNETNSLKDQAAAELQAKAKAEVDRLKKDAEVKAKAEADKLKKQLEDKAKSEGDKAKKKLEDDAKNKLKGLLGK